MGKTNLTRVLKISILFGMICFFFPFVTVSCSGESMTASGAELMTTVSLNNDIRFDDDDVPNYYLAGAFVLSGVGLILACVAKERRKRFVAAGCCAVGTAVLMALFRTTFWSFYQLTGYEGRVTVEFRWGYTLSLISNIVAGCCSFISAYYADDSPQYNWDNSYNRVLNLINGENHSHDRDLSHSDQSPSQELPQDATDALDSIQLLEYEPEEKKSPPVQTIETGENKADTTPVHVIVHVTSGAKKWAVVVDDFPCMIGRDGNTCTITLEDPKASSIHAGITLTGDTVCIDDLDSTNGTRVNGEVITEPVEVLSGDVAEIGTTKLLFEISG